MISSLLDESFAVRPPPVPGLEDQPPARGMQPAAAVSSISEEENDEEVFVFPATAAQRRFWLLDQLVPGGNSALNIALAVRLRGELDVAKLERAFNEILRRHEALRTTFHYEKGQLLQVIAPWRNTALPVVDITEFPAAERARVPAHLMAEEARRPFDLIRGPLIRARLVRLAPCEHLLLFPTHHIVADGWSNGVFLRELGALYTAYIQAKPSPLPELAVQFADFAQWQGNLLEAGQFDPQLDYWRAKLAGQLPVLDLPVDRPRLPWRGRAPAAEIRERPLPGALGKALKALAVDAGASPFMLFLAALSVLLSRYGNMEDFVVATSTANRQRLEVEGLIGLFVNPLLLRLDLTGQPTFRELLGRVRQVALEAFEHADAPFERLVEELQPRRLQVNFLYQQDFLQADRWQDLEVLPVEAGSGGAVYEWNVIVLEDEDGLRLHCEYNAELFDAATIERVLTDYEGLLAAVANGGMDIPVSHWPLRSVSNLRPEADAPLQVEGWRLPDSSLGWMRDHLTVTDPVALSVFRPRAGRRLEVLDGQDQPAPVGLPGELCVVLDGDEAVIPTGDIASRQADGTLTWIGPTGTECKVNGLSLNRARVEAALRAHPHVRRAAVLWHDDEQGLPVLTAYYEGDGAPQALLNAAELHGFLQELLPDEWVPGAFVPVDHFPLSADGRLDEATLPTPVLRPGKDPKHAHDVPYLALHYQIIEIWREVLGLRSVNIRDDFFALGGNSLLAMRMLYRVEQTFGKAVLPATLFRRATVEHLADEILKQSVGGDSPELVRVQEEGSRTPIFFLHGDISGGGFYCARLARDLGFDQPFYALPPLELDRPLEDRPTIEEMAAAHVRIIRSARPQGPYVLGGFCLGGLIAYEVARQLEQAGEHVERLLVIDAGPFDCRLTILRRCVELAARWRGLDSNRQLYLFCRWHYWLARWDRLRRLGWRQSSSVVVRRLRRWWNRDVHTKSTFEPVVSDGTPTAWFDPRLDVPLVFLWAEGGYRAGAYGGAMTLLLSSDLAGGGAAGGNPTRAWRKLVTELEVRELAGDHLACITEHVSDLAATIRKSLETV